MKYFSATYQDFVVYDQKPNEDFYLVSSQGPIFAVADGVTNFHRKNGDYAFPRDARQAAEIFCKTAIEFLEQKKDIKKAFDLANEKIKELNIKYGMDKKLDYVVYDWFDTVAAAGFIAENKLYYGFVGDCGVAIFDAKDKLRFQTKDMVHPAVQRFEKKYEKHGKLDLPIRTEIIHKEFRNNPNKMGYGSFTGEIGVKNYYKLGNRNIKNGDLIVFYTDGLTEFLKDKKFVEILRSKDQKEMDEFIIKKAKEDERRFGKDRTFIAIENL
ncbi:MAG TPA: PP2C family serine/threonine-protein phosphatase [Candidatus Staskawiczbacteria bacterium]|nr:PP2C family serine/threonine-protein phosphatase [Candidatus Staskawiczbacteria bacterium]